MQSPPASELLNAAGENHVELYYMKYIILPSQNGIFSSSEKFL